jgi:MoaF-like
MHADPIRGKTVRWTYADGPMKGKTYEHTFAPDGTVTYHEVGAAKKATPAAGAAKDAHPHYEIERISDDVYAVSYLSTASGYTLTTIVDTRTNKVVSFASNEKSLVAQHGTFEPAAS